jgi:hypothetical protein
MRAATESGVTPGANAVSTERNIYDAYLAVRFDEERVCEIMTWINAGWTMTETTAFVMSVVSQKFASGIHPEVRIVVDDAHLGPRDLRRERVTAPHRRGRGGDRWSSNHPRPRGHGRARR